jgi:hypothetical protein
VDILYVGRYKRTGIGWDERVVGEEGFRGFKEGSVCRLL